MEKTRNVVMHLKVFRLCQNTSQDQIFLVLGRSPDQSECSRLRFGPWCVLGFLFRLLQYPYQQLDLICNKTEILQMNTNHAIQYIKPATQNTKPAMVYKTCYITQNLHQNKEIVSYTGNFQITSVLGVIKRGEGKQSWSHSV